MNDVIIITGAGGMIGSEACKFYLDKGLRVVGIDNNMREYFFGHEGSVQGTINELKKHKNYEHCQTDIRDKDRLKKIFQGYGKETYAVIHTAAQCSHDWAKKEPFTDFEINANGTLNVLEMTRKFCPEAPFVYTSTNKVYGDNPNKLGTIESETRYYFLEGWVQDGIDETLSLDHTTHSIFGVSKAAADLLVQEYGRYFDMNTVCFRGGCLTGKQHKSVELHGFLSYIIKCAKEGRNYRIFGYKGKQVRDQIHNSDCVRAFDEFIKNPKKGAVYNLGGGKENSASILEIIDILKKDYNLNLNYDYVDENRVGDHICYYTDMLKFQTDYPNWKKQYSLKNILDEMIL